jgi:hypothetical protein
MAFLDAAEEEFDDACVIMAQPIEEWDAEDQANLEAKLKSGEIAAFLGEILGWTGIGIVGIGLLPPRPPPIIGGAMEDPLPPLIGPL